MECLDKDTDIRLKIVYDVHSLRVLKFIRTYSITDCIYIGTLKIFRVRMG